MVQSTSVRNSVRLRALEVTPTPSTVLAEEVRGVMLGEVKGGNLLFSVAKRSATTCRLRKISVCSSKMTVTIESPGIDWERMLLIPTDPAMLLSIGWLTKLSTNSADSPGDSV